MKKSIIPSLLLFTFMLSFSLLRSQSDADFTYGLKGGVNYSGIDKLLEIYMSDHDPSTYTAKNEKVIGGSVGFFANINFANSMLAFQPEINYSMEQGKTNYADNDGYQYVLEFKYNYLQINGLLKYYPVGGLNLGVGPQVGFNLSPNNIRYTSNGQGYQETPDYVIEKNMQDVLYGKSNFQVLFNLGYEFKFGLFFDARYALGLSDVIETKSNNFRFQDTNNKTTNFQFTIGYAFDSQENTSNKYKLHYIIDYQ